MELKYDKIQTTGTDTPLKIVKGHFATNHAHTNYYFLQRTQPLEQHKPPATNYMLKDPQYFLHYFEDDERSAPIRPQCLRRSGNAAGLVGRLADATQARPIYSGELVLLCFMIQFRAMTRTASASVTISPRGT